MTSLVINSHPSPNHDERDGAPVDILLLHYTDMPDDAAALAWLCNSESQVSSHYFVHRDGRVLALVPEGRRAWHAGVSIWAGETDVNARSIGIEIANGGHRGGLPEFPDAQIKTLIALCHDIRARHPISPHWVLAHSDVAPRRKQDPGERFPWARLAAEGVGHWVEPAPISDGKSYRLSDSGEPVEALQAMLALYGYGIDVTGAFDQRTADVVAAFQRHFRPARVDGVADHSTLETLRNLLEALP
jgi:N-acetylmuramoyl-L-alanine amidase